MSEERKTAEREFYLTQLTLTSGERLSLSRQFYLSQLTLTEGERLSLEKQWLASQGATGSNREDMWKSFLEGQGYSGAVDTMRRDYYRDNS